MTLLLSGTVYAWMSIRRQGTLGQAVCGLSMRNREGDRAAGKLRTRIFVMSMLPVAGIVLLEAFAGWALGLDAFRAAVSGLDPLSRIVQALSYFYGVADGVDVWVWLGLAGMAGLYGLRLAGGLFKGRARQMVW